MSQQLYELLFALRRANTMSNEPAPAGESPESEPWTDTPNELRRALIEIGDLRTENQALHARVHTLANRIKELTARRALEGADLSEP